MATKKRRQSTQSFGTGNSIDPNVAKAVRRQRTYADKQLAKLEAAEKGRKVKFKDDNGNDVTKETIKNIGPYFMKGNSDINPDKVNQ